MSEHIAGTYATLGGIEIVNESRTFAYLKNGLAPGSLQVYGDCGGCPSVQELVGCLTPVTAPTIDGVSLTGVSGDYVDTGFSGAMAISADLYVGVKFKATDLTPTANQNLIAKWVSAGNQRSYSLQVNTAGGLSLSWSTLGTLASVLTRNSTAALPFTDGTTLYVYATLDADNGAAGHEVRFFYSTTGGSYNPLGSVVLTAGTTSVFNSSVGVELGSQDGGTANLFVGTIYNANVRNGIPPVGSVVGSPNFQPQNPAITTANTSITDPQGNIWTRHGNAIFLPGTVTQQLVVDYSTPSVDGAPWYTTDNPASADFAGFIVTDFDGMSSTFERPVKESTGNGGIFGRSRLATRKFHWKGYLFGTTCCSVQYGLRWLTKTLSRLDTACKDCFGDDMNLLVCCPEDTETQSPFRLIKGVALVDGPKVLSERKTCTSQCSPSGCGGSCILEVEFTLVASQPYFYSPEIPVYDCVNMATGGGLPFTASTIDCGPADCSDIFFDPLGVYCPIPALPPTATYKNSCVAAFSVPYANYFSVPRSYWNDLEEVVPVISIKAGAIPLNRIKLGFYSSSSDNPCGDLSIYPPDCAVMCDDLDIIGIPADSTFYIDGRTRKMAVICSDGSVFPGERLTGGPWSWPSFDCYGFCMEVMYEWPATNPANNLACVSISLVPRTF